MSRSRVTPKPQNQAQARKSPIAALNRGAAKHARLREIERLSFQGYPLHKMEMGNGLRLILFPQPSAPVVALQTWFRVGSRDEEPGKTGMAHFLEHLMFNATTTYPQGEFDRLLETVGGENNAATWTDWTEYHETLPAKELALALDLEADRLVNLALAPDTFESEREVVMSERLDRVDDDPEGKASEELYKLAFKRHGYLHPTIGWMSDIRDYTLEDCEAFYRRYYVPNNATLVLVGDFELGDALGEIQERYGKIHPAPQAQRLKVVEPQQRKERRKTIALDTRREKLVLGYKAPPIGADDFVALQLFFDVLFDGRGAKADEYFVHERSLATSVQASISPFEEPGLAEIWMNMWEGVSAEKSLPEVDRWLDERLLQGVTERELDRAKASAELSVLSTLDAASGMAEQFAFDEVVLGNPLASIEDLTLIRGFTPEAVLKAARHYLKPSRRTVLFVVPISDRAGGNEDAGAPAKPVRQAVARTGRARSMYRSSSFGFES